LIILGVLIASRRHWNPSGRLPCGVETGALKTESGGAGGGGGTIGAVANIKHFISYYCDYLY
jgi:hypothetical protein